VPVNVEIKARVRDLSRLQHLVESLSDGPCTVLRQEDTVFNTPRGRLKLRVISPRRGELIYYEREDVTGPRRSTYVITHTDDPGSLKSALAAALGIRGVVRKERRLYRTGQTRIHLDEVEGLGSFIELEVVLNAGESSDGGVRMAEELKAHLGIDDDDLVKEAYIDLLTGTPD